MSNSLIQRYRTYGELITELRVRTGYVAQGPSANNNKSLLDSVLQEAHEVVYAQIEPTPMRKKTRIKLEVGSYMYDYHNDEEDQDIDPGMVQEVWLIDGEENRYRMIQGISEWHREDSERGQPERYDTLNGQIELYPIPDAEPYDLLIIYTEGRPRFTQNADRPGVSDRLVFLYALYLLQGWMQDPSAQQTLQTFQAMLNREKGKQHENRRYFVSGNVEKKGYVVRRGDKFVYRKY